jgi:hypothetical protein
MKSTEYQSSSDSLDVNNSQIRPESSAKPSGGELQLGGADEVGMGRVGIRPPYGNPPSGEWQDAGADSVDLPQRDEWAFSNQAPGGKTTGI